MGNKKLLRKMKKGQEEMVGFVLIVVVVSVILLFFLSISLQNKETGIESQEVGSFISSFLPYTTECKTKINNLSIRKLIFECADDRVCANGKNSCDVLEDTLKGIVEVSWSVGEENPNKGYILKIASNDREILALEGGNLTGSYKSSPLQNYANGVDITFRVYS